MPNNDQSEWVPDKPAAAATSGWVPDKPAATAQPTVTVGKDPLRGAAQATGIGPQRKGMLSEISSLPVPGTGVTVGEAGERAGQFADIVGTTAGTLFAGPEAGLGIIPSAARAGAKFEKVAGAMEGKAVDVSTAVEAALRGGQLTSRGGPNVKVLNDFLGAIEKGTDMTWQEARDFYSNATNLTSLEKYFGMNGPMRRQVAVFVEGLSKDLVGAAKQFGQAEDYLAAIKEYRNAKRISAALKTVAAAGGAYAAKKVITGEATRLAQQVWSMLE